MNREHVEEVLKKLGAEDVPVDVHRIAEEASEDFNKTLTPSRRHILWSDIMKSPVTKLAAAAVIIIAATLSITLIDKSVTPAYAIEQTIQANHTIQTIHLRIYPGDEEGVENNEFMDCWVKYDDAGLVSNFRWNLHGDVREDDDNLAFTVWNEGVLKTWMPLKNVVIVLRVNNAEKYWQNFARNYDPKLILQRLYDSQENQAIELKIDEPAQGGGPLYVEAINSADNTRLELAVDSETKLVTQLSRYSLGQQGDELDMRIEYFAYNQPIDPFVFELSGIPDDAFVYDQVDQLVGLEKGDLTDNEIAVMVVRQCLEATIAQDYEEVSRLMEGDPGDSFEVFLEEEFEARLTRIASIGQPTPHDIWNNILLVPCEIEIENEERGKWIVNIIATTKPIGYQPGNRWIVHTEIYNHLGLLGIARGELTNDEIAVKVVRECLEATIARDYHEVSRLMEGAPGDSFEEFIEEELGARLVRVISIGQPEPHERWSIILCVPCEIEIENQERGKWIVNIIATAKPIPDQPIWRWVVHADIKVNE